MSEGHRSCKGTRGRSSHRIRRLPLLFACVVASWSLPSSLRFLHLHDRQAALGPSSTLRRHRRSKTASFATYSPAGPGEEWTPEQEQAAMEEVLGRVPPSSQETSSLAAETRLLRVQTQELVKEIRMLRESLQQRKAAQAGSAQPAAAPAAVSPAVAPAPAVAPTPVRAEPPAAPAPPPPTKAPVATPPASASASTATAEPVTSTIAKVVSAGWGDGNVADFFLNGRKIDIRGEAGRRGLNVVTIDPDTQQVMSRKTYDVWADPQTENTRLAADINSLPDGRVILVACKDSGMENLDARAIAALWSAGATVPGGKEREGYALIGIKGSEALAEEQGGRVEIEGELPFFVRHPPPLPPSSPSPPPMPVASQPQQFSPPTWAKEPAAPKPPSTFPTAPPTAEPAQKVRVPKLQVDPQGGVTYQDEMVERDGKPEEQGQSWQEVVLMLDKLQAKIKAKRLAGA